MKIMKKHLVTFGKALGFLTIWILTVLLCSLTVFNQFTFLSNDAVRRLWWELLPMLGVLFTTSIFVWLIEKDRIKIPIFKTPLKSIRLSIVLGGIWLGGTVLILYFMRNFQLGSKNEISYLPIWFLAVLFNVIMQECLVRGYLFSLFKEKYGIVTSVIITTILFTAMHGGIFEAGIVAVLNIITMSVFVSLLLIYTESLLAPIIVHFIWNGIGCLIFGGVSLADDYPSVWNCILTGGDLISGGSLKMEGSILVLIMNMILITFMAFLHLAHCSRESKII